MEKIDWNLIDEPVTWWEKQRIVFNVVVGLTGILSMIMFISNPFGIREVIGILFWGFIANILYSSGILLEIINLYYLKGKVNFFKFRFGFYVFGTLLYCAATFIYPFLYYFPVFD